jgi:hypothetical protein
MSRCSVSCAMLLLCLTLTMVEASAQQKNLLQNPDASEGAKLWRAKGEATVEIAEDGNPYFIIRNAGSFNQVVALPKNSVGQYALLLGRASSERILSDNATAGLPTLQGYMTNGDASAARIYANLQGQFMSSRARKRNEWVQLWGIFRVPAGAERISFIMSQELQPNVPHDDPPARFDDLGVYLFQTEDEARAFVGRAALVAIVKKRESGKDVLPAPECTLTQAPALYGIELGMSVEQVLSLFPGSSQDTDVRRMLEKSKTSGTFGVTDLQLVPSRYIPETKYVNIRVLTLRFLDGRAFSVHALYRGPRWHSTDEFINSMSDEMNLPAPETWEAMPPLHEKFLRCSGFEVRFFGSPSGSGFGNFIRLIDLAAEKTLTERQTAAKE